MHRRFAPKAHRFAYRIFLFAIDLDELDALDQRLRLFSVSRTNLYSFRDSDYLPTGEGRWNVSSHRASTSRGSEDVPPAPAKSGIPGTSRSTLKSRITAYLATHGVDLAGGRVELVTMPRVAGYLFNPVSFYFCYDLAGHCIAAVPEVTNTFREMKPFFLGPDDKCYADEVGDPNRATKVRPITGPSAESYAGSVPSPVCFHQRVPKHFYVSPFSDMDVAFDFKLRPPGERLALQIDDYVGDARMLTSTLTGRARPLTDAALLACTFRHPLMPLRTISLIHWHALRLWLKRVPWFAKAARATDQRDLYRPHHSLVKTYPPSNSNPGALATPSSHSDLKIDNSNLIFSRPTTARPLPTPLTPPLARRPDIA